VKDVADQTPGGQKSGAIRGGRAFFRRYRLVDGLALVGVKPGNEDLDRAVTAWRKAVEPFRYWFGRNSPNLQSGGRRGVVGGYDGLRWSDRVRAWQTRKKGSPLVVA